MGPERPKSRMDSQIIKKIKKIGKIIWHHMLLHKQACIPERQGNAGHNYVSKLGAVVDCFITEN